MRSDEYHMNNSHNLKNQYEAEKGDSAVDQTIILLSFSVRNVRIINLQSPFMMLKKTFDELEDVKKHCYRNV